ncbi:hypothetical protein QLQ12_27685 [Actinoplanes sp. NEAU-A12]|uniref:Zinc ribbon domain-containing protein n=1 Tax=Actinoplanes sandaracinus TaxID=3045177 RepID=A0ABT6WRP1_9ACTN|nr:hypothetical protein [Actinoplanes sandaracinus]MDI6102406.1 hypothetical protein [Actinoplanes sandaracinus]
MVCPTCGLDNDPRSLHCARCNATLAAAPTYPAPPATPGYPTPPPGIPRRNNLPLIIGAAVLVLLTAIGALVYTRTSGEPAGPPAQTQAAPAPTATTVTTEPEPTATTATATAATATATAGDPREQAAAIDAVLSQSVKSRRKLNEAIQRISDCDDLGAAVTDITAVGAERQSQMDTVRNADLSALPTGETLRSGLISALQHAWEADQGFLRWAEPTLTGGCGAANDAGYDRGRAASTDAGAAKRAFLTDWNPVARANGLSTRSADDI